VRNNRLRALLKEGKPTVGTHLLSTWPGIVEVLGQTGEYDYVELVGEYAPYDLYALENFARAAELHGMSAMLKVDQQPRTFLAQRALGSGFDSILFADVRTVTEADECVRIVRAETPDRGGIHGAGMRRNVGYVREPGSADFVRWLDDAVVVLMIEKKGAVENLEEILSLKGVDMLQFGPADYSISIGIPGQWNDAKVREAERRTIDLALEAGVRPRAEVGTLDDAKRYIDLGVRDFCIGTDVIILSDYWKRTGDGLRKALGV